jgi:peptidoglycan/xylan/chitin deacetylase (PgdA/CDA1 family)
MASAGVGRASVSLLAAAAAAAGWIAPSLLRSGPLRQACYPVLAGVGSEAHIALTFDDGPDPAGTPAVLGVLADLGWRATFFLVGEQVRCHPQLARAVAEAGHELALHGDRHRNHLFRSGRDVAADLRRGAETIRAATGVSPVFFRPPFGVFTAGTLAAARRQRLHPVLWTAWGRDWEVSTGPQVAATVLATLDERGTILLHDADRYARTPQSWKATVDALPVLGQAAAEHGWRIGPLQEHFRLDVEPDRRR